MASLDALILHGAGTITGAVGVGDTTISIQVPQSVDLSGSTPVPFAGQDVLIGTEDVRIVTVLSSITHGSNYDYHLTIAPLKNAHVKGTSATFRPYIQRIDVPDPVIIEVGQTLRVNWSDYWKVWGTSRISFSGAGPTTNVYTSGFFHNQYADIKATGVGVSTLDLYLTILLVSGYRFPDSLQLSIGVVEVNQPPVITHTFAPLIFVPGRVTTRTVTPGNHFSDPNNHALTYTATVPSELTATDNGDGTWSIALEASTTAPASGTIQWQAVDARGGTLLSNQTYTVVANNAPIILKQLPDLVEPIGATAHSVYDALDYIVDGGDGDALTYSLEIDDPVIAFATDGAGTYSDNFNAQRFASGHTQYEYAAPASKGDIEIQFRAYGQWSRNAGELINWIGATIDGIRVVAQRRPGTQVADPFFLTLERGLAADVTQSQAAVATGFRYPLSDGRWQLRGVVAGQTTVTLYGADAYSEVSTQALLDVSTTPAWTIIPDQEVEVDEVMRLDLSTYASDVDSGDILTFSVALPVPEQVDVLIVGSILYLRGRVDGDVVLTVTAEDTAGLALDAAINITVISADRPVVGRSIISPFQAHLLFIRSGQPAKLLVGRGAAQDPDTQRGRTFTSYDLSVFIDDFGTQTSSIIQADELYNVSDPQGLFAIWFSAYQVEQKLSSRDLLEIQAHLVRHNYVVFDGRRHLIEHIFIERDAGQNIRYRALCYINVSTSILANVADVDDPVDTSRGLQAFTNVVAMGERISSLTVGQAVASNGSHSYTTTLYAHEWDRKNIYAFATDTLQRDTSKDIVLSATLRSNRRPQAGGLAITDVSNQEINILPYTGDGDDEMLIYSIDGTYQGVLGLSGWTDWIWGNEFNVRGLCSTENYLYVIVGLASDVNTFGREAPRGNYFGVFNYSGDFQFGPTAQLWLSDREVLSGLWVEQQRTNVGTYNNRVHAWTVNRTTRNIEKRIFIQDRVTPIDHSQDGLPKIPLGPGDWNGSSVSTVGTYSQELHVDNVNPIGLAADATYFYVGDIDDNAIYRYPRF